LLDSIEVDWLERPFQEEEVCQGLVCMDGNKALGLNGSAISFFQSCWAIVKDDLMRVFDNFRKHGLYER
jgi:hypothetical protein